MPTASAPGLLTDEMVAARSKARGVSRDRLHERQSAEAAKSTADDVAEAFVYLAPADKTTAAVITVDGGNIEASCGSVRPYRRIALTAGNIAPI